LPSPETKLTLFKIARERFDAAGYNQIGMDHFVLPNDELAVAAARGKLRRNFMGYTVNAAKDWVGIGMSAISYINKCFAQNHGKLDAYSNAIDNGILAAYRGMALSRDDLIRQHIIMELMCNFKLDLTELGDKFDIEPARYFQREFESLKPFVADGLLEFDAVSIKATPAGKMFIRNIAMTFDAYLNRTETERASVQFSRTI
jgi:oxygen-independent coproporphyrinogen-3 oxidase